MEEEEQNREPADWQARLAEAEERGYRRGLNEQIDARMAEPAMYEPLSAPRRPSIWER